MTEVQVENIIVSFSVSSTLDLPKLAEILPDARYHPEDVPLIILQFTQPRSMAALSSTGNIILTGPKSMDEVHEVVKMITDRLSVVGIKSIRTPEISIQNVTVSTNLHQKMKLRNVAKSLKINDYSPGYFPGLIYNAYNQKTVIFLFDSGKIVCNGVKLEDVTIALKEMLEKLSSYGIKKEEDECPK